MLTRAASYDDLRAGFRWRVPARFNMGVDVCDRHAAATPDRLALVVADPGGASEDYTFADLRALSNRLANVLAAHGVGPGDRVGILLSQSVEAAVAHVAAWKMAAVSVPLFTLFGEDALAFRLADSGARALVTDAGHLDRVAAIRDRLPDLATVLVVEDGDGLGGDRRGRDGAGFLDFWRAMDRASDRFAPVDTAAGDPAFICYTSGTTGNPKGALHAHRALLGHLPGMEMFHEFLPRPGDRMWTPADWAWIGGLMNCLVCAWHHGVANVAWRARKYDPEAALRLMARHGVRNAFFPPTALRLMREVADVPSFGARPRTIAVAGEPMGAELVEWGRAALGVTFNEFYGQTECNLVLANCAALMPVKPGSMGRAAVGHDVAVIDTDGNECPPGVEGEIAVRRPDPVLMLRYWNNEAATAAAFAGQWWRMGDAGTRDADGYFWFKGRADDVITSAGYRIGPGEIEDCLCRHPAVVLAAAIGVPDPVRTEAVKAFVKLAPGVAGGPALEEEIRAFVRTRLSPHEYPRLIEFVDDLPLTATGKIRRKELRDAERAKARAGGA
jgi:acetyl-CoA synthetase